MVPLTLAGLWLPEEGGNVSATVENALNNHVAALYPIKDDVLAYWMAARAAFQITPGPPKQRPVGQNVELIGELIDLVISNRLAAAFDGEVAPDIVEIGSRTLRQPMRHQR